MDKETERVRKANTMSLDDSQSMKHLLETLLKEFEEGSSITTDSIASMDNAILELMQMRKRHVIYYMSLLKQGFLET